MALETVPLNDLQVRYAELLLAYDKIIAMLKTISDEGVKVRREIGIVEEELENRGVHIKDVEEIDGHK